MEFVTLRSFGLIFCVLTLCFYGAFGVLEAQIVVVNGTKVAGVVEAEEGDNITLRCEVRGLAQGDTMTWRFNFQVLTTDGRIVITQGPLDGRGDSSTDEALTLTISNVSTRDTGRYVCEVRQQDAENPVKHAEEATLTVFSFPGDGNPACTPSGPLTVYIGDSTALTCASRTGNPPVNMSIFTPAIAPRVTWSTNETGGTITKSTDLVINAPHADFVFICEITSPRYPDERRNCTIGPIRVEQRPQPTTPQPIFSQTPTKSETRETSELTTGRSSAADVSTAQPLPDTGGSTTILSTATPEVSTTVVSPTTSSVPSDTPSTVTIFQQTTLPVTEKLTIATLTNPSTSQIPDPTTDLMSTTSRLSSTNPDSFTTIKSTPTALPSTTGTILTEPKTNPTTSPSDSTTTFPDHSTVVLDTSTIQSATEKGEVSTSEAPPTQLPSPTETSPTSQSSDPITSPLTSLPSPTTMTPELSSQDPVPTAIDPRTHRSSTTGKDIPSKTESPRPKSSHKPPFTTLDHMPPDPMEGDQQPPLYWLIAFIVVAALLILSVVIIVLMCLKMWHMRRFNWTLGTDGLPTREQHERQKGQMKNGIVNGGFYDIPLSPV